MKELTFQGVKTYTDPSYIFSGDQDPNPHDLRPWPVRCRPTLRDFDRARSSKNNLGLGQLYYLCNGPQ